jgi:hypothetical protein
MINLDDRLLSKLAPNELFLLLQIVKRMRVNKMVSWPSIELLAKECNWDERTVKTWRAMLIKKGYIHMELRPGKPTLYRLRKTGIGVYHGVDSDTGVEEETGEGAKIEGVQSLPKKRVQKLRGQGIQNLPPELVNQELLNNGRGLNAKKTTPTHPTTYDEFMERVNAETLAVEAKKEKAPPVAPAPPSIYNGYDFDVYSKVPLTDMLEDDPGLLVNGFDTSTLPGAMIRTAEVLPTNPTPAARILNGVNRAPLAEDSDGAQKLIMEWATNGALETVQNWYNLARRKFTPEDLELMTARFCSTYSTAGEASKRMLFFADPVLFFKNKARVFIDNQKSFDRMSEPKNGIKKGGINSFGGDPLKFQEKQKF